MVVKQDDIWCTLVHWVMAAFIQTLKVHRHKHGKPEKISMSSITNLHALAPLAPSSSPRNAALPRLTIPSMTDIQQPDHDTSSWVVALRPLAGAGTLISTKDAKESQEWPLRRVVNWLNALVAEQGRYINNVTQWVSRERYRAYIIVGGLCLVNEDLSVEVDRLGTETRRLRAETRRLRADMNVDPEPLRVEKDHYFDLAKKHESYGHRMKAKADQERAEADKWYLAYQQKREEKIQLQADLNAWSTAYAAEQTEKERLRTSLDRAHAHIRCQANRIQRQAETIQKQTNVVNKQKKHIADQTPSANSVAKEIKETRDTKEARESKEAKDTKDTEDTEESKEAKEAREGKEAYKAANDKAARLEKEFESYKLKVRLYRDRFTPKPEKADYSTLKERAETLEEELTQARNDLNSTGKNAYISRAIFEAREDWVDHVEKELNIVKRVRDVRKAELQAPGNGIQKTLQGSVLAKTQAKLAEAEQTNELYADLLKRHGIELPSLHKTDKAVGEVDGGVAEMSVGEPNGKTDGQSDEDFAGESDEESTGGSDEESTGESDEDLTDESDEEFTGASDEESVTDSVEVNGAQPHQNEGSIHEHLGVREATVRKVHKRPVWLVSRTASKSPTGETNQDSNRSPPATLKRTMDEAWKQDPTGWNDPWPLKRPQANEPSKPFIRSRPVTPEANDSGYTSSEWDKIE